jgi:hypothetical protein
MVASWLQMNKARRRLIALVSLLLAPYASGAPGDIASAFVGSWYGEFKERGTYGGKPYDSFRGVIKYAVDGRFEMVQRFYFEGGTQLQTMTRGAWGINERLLWLRCETMVVRAREYKCSERQEYSILETSPDKLVYSNNKSKRVHESVRVSDGFELP